MISPLGFNKYKGNLKNTCSVINSVINPGKTINKQPNLIKDGDKMCKKYANHLININPHTVLD